MKRIAGLAAAASLAVLAGCSESIDSEAGCPLLCPSQQVSLREGTYNAVEFDASIATFPPLGAAPFFVLGSSGDSVDAPFVVRFDSLTRLFIVGGETTFVTVVDSSHVRLFVDTLASSAETPFTIEAFDVDTSAADDNFDAVMQLFRPDRLIGSRTFQPGELRDTISVPLSNEIVAERVQERGTGLRVGFRVRSSSTVRIVVFTSNQTGFPRLRYDPAPTNSDINIFEVAPRSLTPADDPALAVDFTDYQLARGGMFPLRKLTTGSDTSGVFRDSILAIGGLARRRAYLRFNIPDSVLNSSIIRATLIMHKKPSSTFGLDDSLNVVPQAVFATQHVPPSKAALIVDSLFFFPIAPQRMDPAEGGEKRFELANFARLWNVDTRDDIPIALSFRIGGEGRVLHEMLFYSTTGPEALRPRLRITFIPRQRLGTP